MECSSSYRLTKVSENGIQKATYTYDLNGNRASLVYSNGVTTAYSYNLANWVTGLYNKKGNTVISSYEYTYYAIGNRKSETDASGKVTSYTYDDLNRIVTEADVDNTITYTYDGRGNRTKRIVTGLDAGTTVYIYDSNNRLTLETTTNYKGTSITAYEYDKNGNNTAKVCGGERLEYVYDAFGKLRRYITNDDIARYAYNSSGIRTLKLVDGDTTKYILNGGDVVGEVSDGETTTTYLRGINLICTDEYYYVFDAHGDVVNLTDANGNTIKTYEYDAFGVEKNPDDSDTNPFRYCGEYWDSETETYYLRARSYDPNLGRFTSEDTYWNVSNMIYGDNPQKINEREDMLGLTTYSYVPQIPAIAQSGNLYVYCINNPVVFADRDGRNAAVALDWWSKVMAFLNVVDGPLPYGDMVYWGGVGILGLIAISSLSETAVVETYETSIAVSQPKALSIPKAEEKVKEKDITYSNPRPSAPTYYHVTTPENAALIMASGVMKGSSWEGGYIYAWKMRPNDYAIKNSGASFGVIISFKTNTAFVDDVGIKDPKVKIYGPVVSARPGPINVRDVRIIG